MKLFSTLLLVSLSLPAFGQIVNVYPQIINMGSQVQLQVHNHTNFNIFCSGFVNIFTMNNMSRTEYFSEFISARMMRNRTYFLPNFNDRVRFANHSITCRPN